MDVSDIPVNGISADVTPRAVPYYEDWSRGFGVEARCHLCGGYDYLTLTDSGFQCASGCPEPDVIERALSQIGVRA
jgi:hypothetical protein